MYRLLMTAVSAALLSTVVQAEDLTCNNVVKPGDTAETIKARLKGDASVEKIKSEGAEGEEGEIVTVLTLFPKDAARKLTVTFSDDRMTKLAGIAPASDKTSWTIAGLKIGSSVADVAKANGGPFDLSGFEWDYGGYVNDLKGGKLSSIDGGCFTILRFNTREGTDVPEALSGDRTISSSEPELARLDPFVSSIELSWPGPDDQQGGAN